MTLEQRIREWCEEHGRTWQVGKPSSIGYRDLSRALGESSWQVRKAMNGMRAAGTETATAPEQTETREESGDVLTLSVKNTRIDDVDKLLAHCKVDLRIWEVERSKIVKSEVGMKPPATTEYVETKDGRRIPAWVRFEKEPVVEPLFHITVWLRKKHSVAAALEELAALREKAEKFAPVYPVLIFKDRERSGNLAEVSIADHHFGRQCWARETGWADYDTKIARRVYEDAFTTLIKRIKGYGIDEVLLPVGNDLQHTDNRQGTTTRGTPQDTDSRYQKVFETARDCAIWSIEAAMALAPKVTVLLTPGNHDFLTTWHLGDTLQAWFRNCKNVTVDNEPLFRKYHQHGTVMLMFTHGNAGKLEDYPLVMASEQPSIWGATRWHEAHTGDKHQRRLVELKGAAVRILPSLCPPDAWSSENCYIGSVRAAEAYVWNRDAGLIGTAVYSVLPQPDGPKPNPKEAFQVMEAA